MTRNNRAECGNNRELKFGTSGLRGLVSEMTDREIYVNTQGFLSFLEETGITQAERVIALGGDLRESTPRIMAAVTRALNDRGWRSLCAGNLPSPALALIAMKKGIAGIMVTGSHIPEDRNGIKFTKKDGEILKDDEPAIIRHVRMAREAVKTDPNASGLFSPDGMFKLPESIPLFSYEKEALDLYLNRYMDFFPLAPLAGITLAHYEQSAVGRYIVTKTLEKLGAKIISTGRCKKFIPVDTEKISRSTGEIFKEAARQYSPFAVISTDGDSDRPLLSDENGEIIPGDKLGALAALYLKVDFAALPVTTNEAVIKMLEKNKVHVQITKIGSPYVIKAMNERRGAGTGEKIAGWEANGGFLTATDWTYGKNSLKALCTRDALLPIIAALLLAKENGLYLSKLCSDSFEMIYSRSDILDSSDAGMENYTAEQGRQVIDSLSPDDKTITQLNFTDNSCTALLENHRTLTFTGSEMMSYQKLRERLSGYFSSTEGFAEISSLNFIDGIRITFINNETVHLRPSGNAPEFRVYTFAATPGQAEKILEKRLSVIPRIFSDMTAYTP